MMQIKKMVSEWTFKNVLETISSLYSNRIAFSVYGKANNDVSYEDLKKYCNCISLFLISLGLKKQDKIAILANNSPNWMIA